MKRQFFGSLADLKNVTWNARLIGSWTECGDHWRFDYCKAILNFWPKTQTVNFQGNADMARQLAKTVIEYADKHPPHVFVDVP